MATMECQNPSEFTVNVFEKSKVLTSDSINFVLPCSETLFTETLWQVDRFLEMKTLLNSVKSKINNQNLVIWHAYTRKISPLGLINELVKQTCNPENLTRAWLKMYECVSLFDLIPESILNDSQKDLNTLHLCEAPGAFIASLNHFMKTNHASKKWNWMATTLNPYYEGNDTSKMINDDSLLRFTYKNWTFLADNTGNLIDGENINSLSKEAVERLDKISLITADGSIDCQDDPGEQESRVSSLNFAEIVAALSILEEGGNFLLKMFTVFECQSICHLYLLSCTFKQVTIFKPATSGEGNSEVYIICQGFKGTSSCRDQLSRLQLSIDNKDTSEKALFRKQDIPDAFFDVLYNASKFFTMIQVDVIEKNLAFFDSQEVAFSGLLSQQKSCSESWLQLTKLKYLPDEQKLLPPQENHQCKLISLQELRYKQKSYAELNQEIHEKSVTKKLQQLLVNLSNYTSPEYFFERFLIRVKSDVRFEVGRNEKLYKNITNSRYCSPGVMSVRRELREFVVTLDIKYCNTIHDEEHRCREPFISFQEILRRSNVNRGAVNPDDLLCQEICCHDSHKSLVHTTDMEITVKIMESVLHILPKLKFKTSLFLCEYPLLSRLQIGFLNFLETFFEHTKLSISIRNGIIGIYLFNYKGVDENSTSLFGQMKDVVHDLKTKSHAPLSLMEMDAMDDVFIERIFRYNTSSMYFNIKNFILSVQEPKQL